jgi:chemotaxis protein CheD
MDRENDPKGIAPPSLMSNASIISAGNKVFVGLADCKVGKDPNVILCSLPLGACLAVTLYDPVSKTGGLLHGLLPSSSMDPARAARHPAMFLDSGVKLLLSKLKDMKAEEQNIQVSIVGGAEFMDDSNLFNVGKKNYEFISRFLPTIGLTISAEDIGGRTNRSLMLHLGTGELFTKQTGQSEIMSLCKK